MTSESALYSIYGISISFIWHTYRASESALYSIILVQGSKKILFLSFFLSLFLSFSLMGHFVVTLWSPSRLASQEFSMMPNDSKFNFAHFISKYFLSIASAGITKWNQNWSHFSISVCHPCAGALLVVSVSFQLNGWSPKGVLGFLKASAGITKWNQV